MAVLADAFAYSGFATVGTGTTSRGTFNLSNFGSVSACIQEALSQSPGVVLLAGDWQLDQAITMPGEGRALTLGPGCVLRNAVSGAAGVLSVTGARCQIIGKGGKIVVSNWVNSQAVVSVASGGNWFVAKDLFVDVTASGGNTTTPMTVLSVVGVLEPRIENNVILPNKGVRAIHLSEGHGGRIVGNRIRNDSLLGIGSAASEPPQIAVPSRKCFEAIRVDGGQWFTVKENLLWGLGDSTDPLMEGIIYNWQTTPTVSEEGHFTLRENQIEECYMGSGRAIALMGARWFNCDQNKIGWLRDSLTSLGHAAIYVGGRIISGSESAVADDATANGTLFGNEIHNPSASHAPPIGGGNDKYGATIYVSYAKNLLIGPTLATLSFGYASMVLDLARCDQVSVFGHLAVSNDITGEAGILLLNSGGHVRFFGNIAHDFQIDNVAGATPTTVDLTGLEGYELTGTTISFDNASGEIRDSGNGLAKFKRGGWVWVEGAGAGTNAGKFFRVTTVDVTGSDITVTPAPADQAAGASVTVKQIDTNRHLP